ncbi:MAG TPA: ThuA domain-containing protein [Bacteroidales bacterium]|nr:ThuA domain-containing protein [Bacteroidales bacterium]
MKNTIFLLLIMLSGIASGQSPAPRVLVITGGHDYNISAFNGMFDSLPGKITHRVAELPGAFDLFKKEHRDEYDVVVFYHMWQDITAEQAADLSACIKEGKPLVVLHHSICAFDDWDEYVNITGGRYFHRKDTIDGHIYGESSYQHDVPVHLVVKDKNHPVTRGIPDFTMVDETYDNFYVQPGIITLITTDTPGSTGIIGWTKQYGKARVVTLQSGHNEIAFRNANFRRLLWQAIQFTIYD